jgi:hypothetical protein
MSKVERILEIQRHSKKEYITGTTSLVIRGEEQKFNIYRVPLSCLVYNHLNGRFASKFKSFEAIKGRALNNEAQDDIQLIEHYLWNSNSQKNTQTEQNIMKFGQLEYGIITEDGRIIDGNRRAMILNRICWNNANNLTINLDKYRYFKTIVLTGHIDDRELVKLETMVQLGKDEKEGYNPIEKYLKVEQLLGYGYNYVDISAMMNETVKTIEKYDKMLNLFKEYLEYIGWPEVYELLDETEGPIQDLHLALTSINRGSHACVQSRETIDNDDIEDLKNVVFDYIRLKPTRDHKDLRTILGGKLTENANGVFGREEIWNDFRNKHFDYTNRIDQEKIIIERDLPEASDHLEKAKAVERLLRENYRNDLLNNLEHHKDLVRRGRIIDEPKHLLEEVLTILERLVETEAIITERYSDDEEFDSKLRDIQKLINRLRR